MADVTGAGDTVVAVLAACLGSGWGLAEACRLANVAAGIAVSHPGTYVVHADELAMAWKGLSHKILNREAARRRLADARRRGRKVVFTNGCFDILHAGHLASLEGSKRLGDLLVVGLNSDASVRRLKGDSRPVDRPGEPRQPAGRPGLRRRRRDLRRADPRGADPPARSRRAGQGGGLHAGPDRRRRLRPEPRRPGRHPPPGARAEHDRDPRAERQGRLEIAISPVAGRRDGGGSPFGTSRRPGDAHAPSLGIPQADIPRRPHAPPAEEGGVRRST